MRIAVDFPAPFSPTIAWIVPARTVILRRSLASTFPNRLLILRSSSIFALLLHRVGYFDLSGNDFLARFINGSDDLWRKQVFVVLIGSIANTFVIKAVHMDSPDPAAFHTLTHNLINGVIDALHHAGQNVAWLHPVLVVINANHKLQRVALSVFAVLFDGIEGTQTGIAGGSENNVYAFFDLRAGKLFTFDGVIPCGIGHTDVIRNHADVRFDGVGSFFVSNFK